MSVGEWARGVSGLDCLEDESWQVVREAAQPMHFPAGTVLFRDGDPCRNYMLVLDGSVRVQKEAENGREITLYRVRGGQSCVLTTACMLAGDRYPARGVAETDVNAVAIPLDAFELGLARSPDFRRFVFSAYGNRITNLILLVEEVAFGRIDVRLAQRLSECAGSGRLECTHQELAAELGTAREVVSRQLKEFEREGLIRLGRGAIELLAPSAIAARARQPGRD